MNLKNIFTITNNLTHVKILCNKLLFHFWTASITAVTFIILGTASNPPPPLKKKRIDQPPYNFFFKETFYSRAIRLSLHTFCWSSCVLSLKIYIKRIKFSLDSQYLRVFSLSGLLSYPQMVLSKRSHRFFKFRITIISPLHFTTLYFEH